MKIGSFQPLQSNLLPNKQVGQVAALQHSNDAAAETHANPSQNPANVLPYSEFVEAAEQLASSQAAANESRLFNHNRDLSFNSQSALSAYNTNESFQSFSQGELVGVDLYV